ncbi:unnamed protein product [Linum tenue]|uniref:Uncharacterized protein n=1 Tax=Linum tenue TaxID=586396 RepID=A0AAV0R5X2_9ROSI|nr:unnamed protein product [Linum tenue]
MTTTRHDLMYYVCLLRRFMESPTRQNMLDAKRILRYMKESLGHGIWYRRRGEGGGVKLIGYTDSDYAGDVDDKKSTSGYAFFLIGGVFSWTSKKQPIVILSTTEA